MASVRESRGRLFLDYRVDGKRQRVYVKLADTSAHREQLRRVAKEVDATLATSGDPIALLARLGLLEDACGISVGTALQLPTIAAKVTVVSLTPALSVFANQWFSEFKVSWRKTYITTVRGILDQHLLPRFGATAVGSVTRAQILDFRSTLAAGRGRRAGTKLSPARINTVMLILRQILQEAADRYEFTMPMARLKPLKVPKSDVKPFSLDETHLVINSVRKDYRDYMVVRFFTGMRSGEIHGLKWKYVDFERRIILVREALVGGEEEYTKNDSSQRDIPMSQLVFDALQKQHKATGKMTYVFCNLAGEPLDTNNFTKRVWYPLLRHLGLALRRPYQTRHTAATLWLAAGEAPDWIAHVLGHTSTEMLFRVYSRFVPNLTRRDGSAFDRLLTARFGGIAPEGSASGGVPAKDGAPAPDKRPPAQPPPERTWLMAA